MLSLFICSVKKKRNLLKVWREGKKMLKNCWLSLTNWRWKGKVHLLKTMWSSNLKRVLWNSLKDWDNNLQVQNFRKKKRLNKKKNLTYLRRKWRWNPNLSKRKKIQNNLSCSNRNFSRKLNSKNMNIITSWRIWMRKEKRWIINNNGSCRCVVVDFSSRMKCWINLKI